MPKLRMHNFSVSLDGFGAAIVGRATGATDHRTYKMPWWPVPPILAIVYITTKQTSQAIRVTSITMLIGLVHWAVVIWPQRGKAWNLKEPILDEAAHIEAPVKMP